MTYATPPTKVLGDSAPASDWNTFVRDNSEHFANDADHGSANGGSQTLGATGGLTSARFTDASAPSAPGSGKTEIFSVSGKAGQRAGAAGSAEEFSVTTHTHTQASGAETTQRLAVPKTLSSTSYTDTTGDTLTPSDSTGSSQFEITHFGYGAWRNTTGTSGTLNIRLLKASVQQVEVSIAMAAPVESGISLEVSFVYIALAASSTAFDVEHKKTGTHSNVQAWGLGQVTREVQCL